MNKKEFLKQLDEGLKALGMAYYDKKKLDIVYEQWVHVTIKFTVPYYSLRSLIEFCESNKDTTIAYCDDGLVLTFSNSVRNIPSISSTKKIEWPSMSVKK